MDGRMKTFKKRINIKDATQYKLLYNDAFEESIKERIFDKLKSMEQWISRNDTLSVSVLNKYAFIGNRWYPFIAIGNKYLTANELKMILNDLEFDYYKSLKPKK